MSKSELNRQIKALRAPMSAKMLMRAGALFEVGHVRLITPAGEVFDFGEAGAKPYGEMRIKDWAALRLILLQGDIGMGEGYIAGHWDTPDLSALLEVMTMNLDAIQKFHRGGFAARVANFLRHAFNANTRNGSKRNILAHYDLGNTFYQRWLDPSMTYSSGVYDSDARSLEEAQRAKYAALANSLKLQPGQHVLEIGCGWGGFAEYAAKERGAKVTGITISDAQSVFARERMKNHGLENQVDIRLIDYRDVTGQFDAVASIEMFEAVGEQYWPTYFNKVQQVLKPGGRAGLQIITIDDDLFPSYRTRADFIQRYIFPGGMLPSVKRLKEEFATAGLKLEDMAAFGQSYARTLQEWSERFHKSWRDIKELGFDERFKRLWHFYLHYCEAGFKTRRIDVAQFALSKI